MRKYLQLLFSFIFIPALSISQISFADSTHLMENPIMFSGAPIGVVDMHGDGLDDIVCLDNRHFLYVYFESTMPRDGFIVASNEVQERIDQSYLLHRGPVLR